jgi:hypothetical protein
MKYINVCVAWLSTKQKKNERQCESAGTVLLLWPSSSVWEDEGQTWDASEICHTADQWTLTVKPSASSFSVEPSSFPNISAWVVWTQYWKQWGLLKVFGRSKRDHSIIEILNSRSPDCYPHFTDKGGRTRTQKPCEIQVQALCILPAAPRAAVCKMERGQAGHECGSYCQIQEKH